MAEVRDTPQIIKAPVKLHNYTAEEQARRAKEAMDAFQRKLAPKVDTAKAPVGIGAVSRLDARAHRKDLVAERRARAEKGDA